MAKINTGKGLLAQIEDANKYTYNPDIYSWYGNTIASMKPHWGSTTKATNDNPLEEIARSEYIFPKTKTRVYQSKHISYGNIRGTSTTTIEFFTNIRKKYRGKYYTKEYSNSFSLSKYKMGGNKKTEKILKHADEFYKEAFLDYMTCEVDPKQDQIYGSKLWKLDNDQVTSEKDRLIDLNRPSYSDRDFVINDAGLILNNPTTTATLTTTNV